MSRFDIEAVNEKVKWWNAKTDGDGFGVKDWRNKMDDEALLGMYSLCMLSSKEKFTTVEAFVKELKSEGLFDPYQEYTDEESYRQAVRAVLSARLPGVGGFNEDDPDLRESKSRWLARVAFGIRDPGPSFREILHSSALDDQSVQPLESARKVRKHLADEISGLGPKASSMFLRKVGYYLEFALLDYHVLRYLKKAGRVDEKVKQSRLSKDLAFYEKTESVFAEMAKELGSTVKCADEAIWMELSGTPWNCE